VVAVTPTADGGEGPAGTDSAVIGDSPPEAPVVAITPASPVEGDGLVCEVITGSNDADGDAVSYAFAWDVDGSVYGGAADGATTSTVDGAEPLEGEVWTCSVTPDDGTLEGDAGTDSVEIGASGVVSGSRRVFVTSTTYDGDLGGLAGADEACQDSADAAGLGGAWRAWLSDSSTDVADRLVHPDGPLVRVDGVEIAADWDALVAGWPTEAPEVDEHGAYVSYDSGGITPDEYCSWLGGYFFFPWTASTNEGALSGETCDDWTSASSARVGRVGLGGYSLSQWTDWCDFPCDWAWMRLYCFEQ